jgi:hypothetical protein
VREFTTQSAADYVRECGASGEEIQLAAAFDRWWAEPIILQTFDELEKVSDERYHAWCYEVIRRLTFMAYSEGAKKQRLTVPD